MSRLFEPWVQRSLRLRNRIAVAPMCQYSAVDGVVNHWHLVHLGSRAVGGAGLVIAEATAVEARGRISPRDAGLWNDAQAEAWRPLTRFIREAGAIAGVQLAHAGRKASVEPPWLGGGPAPAEHGGWSPVVGPSALAFDARSVTPAELDAAELAALPGRFASAAQRALAAGFELVELHAAHGYLLHEFLSPASNRRHDAYGGDFEARTRLLREVVAAVRAVWPGHLPLWVRISATDWIEHDAERGPGWELGQSIELARRLRALGVDLIDVSSGGNLPGVTIPAAPGYQVPFAARIRREAGIATGAVGLITRARQAEAILDAGEADCVLLARELLRDPYWPCRAAQELGVAAPVALPYQRAW